MFNISFAQHCGSMTSRVLYISHTNKPYLQHLRILTKKDSTVTSRSPPPLCLLVPASYPRVLQPRPWWLSTSRPRLPREDCTGSITQPHSVKQNKMTYIHQVGNKWQILIISCVYKDVRSLTRTVIHQLWLSNNTAT